MIALCVKARFVALLSACCCAWVFLLFPLGSVCRGGGVEERLVKRGQLAGRGRQVFIVLAVKAGFQILLQFGEGGLRDIEFLS